MDDKLDLRVKKTQRALAMSLLDLLKSHPFSKITVNDICVEAMVSRSAFYANFEDKYDLLRFCLHVLKQRIFQNKGGISIRESVQSALQHIYENKKICKHLMESDCQIELCRMMQNSFYDDMILLYGIQPEDFPPLPGPPDIISVFFSSAITGTIVFWLNQAQPYSVEELTSCVFALFPPRLQERTE